MKVDYLPIPHGVFLNPSSSKVSKATYQPIPLVPLLSHGLNIFRKNKSSSKKMGNLTVSIFEGVTEDNLSSMNQNKPHQSSSVSTRNGIRLVSDASCQILVSSIEVS